MRLPLAIAVLGTALLWTAAPAAHGAYRGRLEIRHSDDFARQRTQTNYRLVRRGRNIPLVLARAPRIPSGSAVVVRGRRVGSRIRGTVRTHGTARAATVPAGPRKTAVILIKFTSADGPFTPAVVRQSIFTASNSANAFYTEESAGDVSLTGNLRSDGDVFGWYTVAGPTAGCDTNLWASQARSAAAVDGFVASEYDHLVYVFPQQASCGGWAGLGELPGTQSWMNGTVSTRVVAHELGHNMGLHHASSLRCTADGQPVAYSSSCTPDEYGDPFDVMGGVLRRNSAWHLKQLGTDFMPPANVQTASSNGTYTLTSSSVAGPGTRLLRVPQPGTPNRYYDLELRSSSGVFDNFLSTDPVVHGVSIRLDPASQITQSLLIDATPGSNTFADAPFAQGQTFSDGSVSITVQSVTGSTATVDVAAAPAPDTTPPSVPAPVAEPAADRVELSWPASTDNVAVAGYRVYRGFGLVATTAATGWTDTAVTPGATYSYRVAAYDAAGNVATSSFVSATVPGSPPAPEPAPDTSPPPDSSTPPVLNPDPPLPPADTARPSVQIASPARRAHMRRRAVVRASAFDAVGVVRTDVWVDGVLRKSASGGRVAWRWPLRHTRRGRHLVIVRAFDAAGNRGMSSVRVRLIG